MPFDYWDLDDILSEQQEIFCRPLHDIVSGGMLQSIAGEAAREKDLAQGTKIKLPFWLAQTFVRRSTIELDLPIPYNETIQEDLERDAIVCRIGDKSQYYFEIGIKIASFLHDAKLSENLLNALEQRWIEVVTSLGRIGVALQQRSHLNPGSVFPQTLTAVEHDMFHGGKEAERHFKHWMDSFGFYQIGASQIIEAPMKKLKRS